MRVLRNVLLAGFAVFAVVGGMFVAVALALAGALVAAFTRLMRPATAPAGRPPRRPAGNVIDVAATEVKSPPLLR